MPARDTRLIAFAHLGAAWVPCGQLSLSEEGQRLQASSFAYGLNYLKRANALEVDPVSLAIPVREADRGTVRGRRLLPANRLPFFGGIRDAAPDAWGRRVIGAKLRAPANSLAESQYLLHAGSERVGALDIRAGLNDGPAGAVSAWHGLAHLMEAAERIDNGEPVPAHLDAIFHDGSSLGGARPKASVRDEAGVLWLAKFASRTDRFDVPGIESAVLLLAREAGLRVPPVRALRLGDRRFMLIRRFDRHWCAPGHVPDAAEPDTAPGTGRAEHRLGFVSALTLLACDEMDSRTRSYADIADAIRRHAHPDVIRADTAEVFKRMVFNIFVSNDDDHLRNHGFLWDPALPGWRLSPLYDVLPRPGIAQERFLHLGVGPHGRAATLDNALAGHARFALTRPAAARLIAEVWAVLRQWRVSFDRYGVPDDEQQKIAPAFRHLDEVSGAHTRKALP